MIRNRFFNLIAAMATTRWRQVVYLAALAATAASIILIPRLAINTTRQGMVSDDLPIQINYMSYMDDFGTPNVLVVALEGPKDSIKQAADKVADALAAEPQWVRTVFHRVDLEPFKRTGLHYLPQETLVGFRDFLAKDPTLTQELLAGRNLAQLIQSLEGLLGGASEEDLNEQTVGLVDELLAKWQAYLNGETQGGLELDGHLEQLASTGLTEAAFTDPDGYLLSYDGEMAFLFVQQARKTDESSFILPFMEYARRTTGEALADFPGVSAGFTGLPTGIQEDYQLLMSDLVRISIIATFIILAIFLAAFRSLHRTIVVFIPLVLGVIWNLGIIVLTVGHLNYLSSVFVGILFGLGIDFGIYFVRRFDEERLSGKEPAEAMLKTLTTVGQGIVTGGMTAVVAFLAIGMTDQPAFAELGIVAGTGVASVLAATLLLLPPLLVQFPPGLKRARTEVASPVLANIVSLALRRPLGLIILLGLAVLVVVVKVPQIRFDYNLNNLLPKDSEMINVLREMERRSPFSDQFIVVLADDLDQVRKLHTAIEKLESVERVESLATILPQEEQARPATLADLGRLLGSGKPQQTIKPDLPALRLRLDKLVGLLETAEEDAFAANRQTALKSIGVLLNHLSAIRTLLDQPPAEARQAAFETALFDLRDELAGRLTLMTKAEPITLETLDPNLRGRFVGASGRLALLAFPSKPIWEQAFLDRFVLGVRRAASSILGQEQLDERVTGFAVTYQVTAPMIRRGFNQATWAAGLVVILMLLLDLRRPRLVALAILPLLATVLILLGAMAWLGIKLNMATQVAFPILFGLGVAYGVHMVHRWTEPDGADLSRVVGTTGKAIGLAALTTMAGFGAMMLARHSALSGFGSILFAGIALCVLTALFALPVLITALHLKPGGRSRDDK